MAVVCPMNESRSFVTTKLWRQHCQTFASFQGKLEGQTPLVIAPFWQALFWPNGALSHPSGVGTMASAREDSHAQQSIVQVEQKQKHQWTLMISCPFQSNNCSPLHCNESLHLHDLHSMNCCRGGICNSFIPLARLSFWVFVFCHLTFRKLPWKHMCVNGWLFGKHDFVTFFSLFCANARTQDLAAKKLCPNKQHSFFQDSSPNPCPSSF